MAPDRRRSKGALGERIAELHLAREGYEIVERNFRTRYGEVDLIAADDRCIVFCEVKTRVGAGRSGPLGPLDAIGPTKRRRLRVLARQWLRARTAGVDRPFRDRLRFDAIGITLTPGGRLLELEHVRDAF
jgi:putative endonuclease